MPQYKVKSVGFYEGKLYDPEGKRKVLNTDKPFPKGKIPSWVEPITAAIKTAKKVAKPTTTPDPDFGAGSTVKTV